MPDIKREAHPIFNDCLPVSGDGGILPHSEVECITINMYDARMGMERMQLLHRTLSILGVAALLAGSGSLLAWTALRRPPHATTDGLMWHALGMPSTPDPATGPLRVLTPNPRYFTDGSGRAILLSGSHTWLDLQDGVLTDPPSAFDYAGWLNFMVAHHHNFFRLYSWEQAKWVAETATPYYFAPNIYARTGPGTALDGKPQFDLTRLNQAYFDRLRQRIAEAGRKGIYVSVQLFNGWSVKQKEGATAGQPWLGHPFNAANNINGVNGDPKNTGDGRQTEDLSIPAITALQEAYVRKVIATVDDLPNVLYEICNESDDTPGNVAWQEHFIDFIHRYEATLPYQHPVGFSSPDPADGATLPQEEASGADWVAPNNHGTDYLHAPPPSDGRKVVVLDTDHLCGLCSDEAWVWKAFTSGYNLLFMDQYDNSYHLTGGNYDSNDPATLAVRKSLGYIRIYAQRMNLGAMRPRPGLSSTGYVLANTVSPGAAEYLVYDPTRDPFSVDLSHTSGTFSVEWFNPTNGGAAAAGSVTGGGRSSITPPGSITADAVLYLKARAAVPDDGRPSHRQH